VLQHSRPFFHLQPVSSRRVQDWIPSWDQRIRELRFSRFIFALRFFLIRSRLLRNLRCWM
jgi:hypothetical protein